MINIVSETLRSIVVLDCWNLQPFDTNSATSPIILARRVFPPPTEYLGLLRIVHCLEQETCPLIGRQRGVSPSQWIVSHLGLVGHLLLVTKEQLRSAGHSFFEDLLLSRAITKQVCYG